MFILVCIESKVSGLIPKNVIVLLRDLPHGHDELVVVSRLKF